MEVLHVSPRFRGFNVLTLHSFEPSYRSIDFCPFRKPFHSHRLLNLGVRRPLYAAEHNHTHNHHGHDHNHHHHGDEGSSSKLQEAILVFAKGIRWLDLANHLRENLQLCCCSAVLFVAAASCPYFIPKPAVRPLQKVFILIGFPLVGVSSSLDALLHISGGKVNIHVLMALAAFASVIMGNCLEGGLLLAMFNLAHIAEEYFTSRSMIDVKELKESYPDFAVVLDIENDTPQHFSQHFSHAATKKIPVHDLKVGLFLLVRAGEFVPVDCEVVQGRSTITIEHLTGEVKPLERIVGDSIPGGARSEDGMMILKALRTWKDSTLNKIVQLTEEARLCKPKLQRWLDEFGEHYSKMVVIISVAVALVGPFLFKWPFMSTAACRGSIYRALGFMMAASPCALAVAPLAYATATSACARKGILLKGGHVLDALATCHTVAFDKTGTLTTGMLKVKAIEPIIGHDAGNESLGFASCCTLSCEKEALAVAAAMEQGTTHPIGRAVLEHAIGKDIPSLSVENFESFPGRGLSATLMTTKPGHVFEPVKASLGSVEFITSLCKSEDESNEIKKAAKISSYGHDLIQAALSVNKKVTLLHFEDEPRDGVLDVITTLLGQANLRIIMLTGDHKASAWRVANAVGIREVYYSLKPEDKLNYVKGFSRNDGGLVMVGDGVNDAPALAAATVGMVLAHQASATAVAAADVLLLQDNISGVLFSIAKSRQTTNLVKQNVALALSSIMLAALPSVMGFLPLWLTVLLHEGGTLVVCLNSLRGLCEPAWSWREEAERLLPRFQPLKLLRHGH